ncbi:MAG: hypothetical protein CMC76_08605 [Flavobacteriaceae bacterium]|nr:hypothetical protein [Flavobacteriaceae bacterium]|tara:strand:- start:2729 stop:3238 length:510 start_codon:yes stop_codon:yes gene_type:complete
MKTFKILSILCIAFSIFSCDPEENSTETPNIDLMAESISFSVVVDSNNPFTGVATITGTIRNIGDNYMSNHNQQSIYLYERSLGTPTTQLGTLVAQQSFQNLDTDETAQVTFSRTWNSSSPAEGEFPPEYIILISYDPDLYIDNNVHNDDTNQSNDQLLVSGEGINNLF